MALKQQIDEDLKAAMLAGDKTKTTLLRGLKSAILYAEVAKGTREQGLADDQIVEVLAKEAKKRVESAELYAQGGNKDRQQTELDEKKVIDKYLPEQLTEAEVKDLIDEAEKTLGKVGAQTIGPTIAWVKQKSAGQADGAEIARLVKERL